MVWRDVVLVLMLRVVMVVPANTIYDFIPGTVSEVIIDSASSDVVTYSCSVINRWNKYKSPMYYPPNARWSGPVLVSSKRGYHMWGPDQMASAGVQQVAETGDAYQLLQEMEENSNVADYVIGEEWILDGNPGTTNKQTLHSIEVSAAYPYLSSIVKVVPSPDWFSGFYGLPLLTGKTWYQDFVVLTYPWDAGTQAGNAYQSTTTQSTTTTRSTTIQLPIVQLTPDNIDPATGPFLSPGLDEVLNVLEWHCQMVPNRPPTTTDTRNKSRDGGAPSDATSNTERPYYHAFSSSSLFVSLSCVLLGMVVLC